MMYIPNQVLLQGLSLNVIRRDVYPGWSEVKCYIVDGAAAGIVACYVPTKRLGAPPPPPASPAAAAIPPPPPNSP